jgi:DNA polymerase-3 subunit chi
VTRVDFYVLGAGADAAARERFVARLAHRARRERQHVYVHVDGAEAAARLDALLWEYPEGAFLPHGIAGSRESLGAAVCIGHGTPPDTAHDLLVNLGGDIPDFFSSFARVAEVVGGDAAARETARERFRFYRDRGYPLAHHDVR